MNKKYLLLILILLTIPIIASAENNTESANALLKYIKGDGAFESWFFNAFVKMNKNIQNMAFNASVLGRTIGGLGALMSLGYMGWQMQSGDRDWEVMPILKPFFIGLILLNWTSFYQIIEYPFSKIAEPSMAVFNTIDKQANDLRVVRFAKQRALIDFLIKQEAEQKIKEAESSKIPFSEAFAKLSTTIHEWGLSMKFSSQKLISELLEAIGLTLLRVMTYFVFFIQKIWSYILIVLGPIAIGFTLIPGFQSSLTNWIAKFVNINLYSFIAYTIINVGQILIISAYSLEIDRLNHFMDSSNVIKETSLPLISQFLENSGMMYSVLFTVVAYLITGMGVLMTPTIADSIVSAGGAGVMSKMKSAGTKMAAGANATGGISGNVMQRSSNVGRQMRTDIGNIKKSPTERMFN